MDKDAVWALFEKTGNIRAYMLYHDLNSNVNNSVTDNYNREAAHFNANENRWADNTRHEYR